MGFLLVSAPIINTVEMAKCCANSLADMLDIDIIVLMATENHVNYLLRYVYKWRGNVIGSAAIYELMCDLTACRLLDSAQRLF